MLRRITIDNYALIDHLEMELDESLNIITGETGAGKSILLGALGLLLGNKNDGSAIKDNTQSCVIEAVFDIESLNLKTLFEEQDWEWDSTVVVRRMISPSGKSRAFINDVPVQLVDLKMLGSQLIDIHSQHQNRSLSDEDFRLRAIDLLADNGELLSSYRAIYSDLLALRRELSEREQSAESLRREQEWLSYQVEELTTAALKEGEDKQAEAELLTLENADRITEALTSFVERADDENYGLLMQAKSSLNLFSNILESYPPAKEYSERLQSIVAEVKDMSTSMARERESVEADPERMERLSDRLNTIYSLCQKHRVETLTELVEVRDKYTSQLSSITEGDERISKLKSSIEKSEAKAQEAANELNKRRVSVAPQFEAQIVATLEKLGMSGVVFKVDITALPSLAQHGADSVAFLFSANAGMAPQSVERLASGGEISRVMLSLKALLASRMSLPTIIFDEIDTGVSGRIADAMGDIISQLSRSMQVVDITHLPQVASKGDTHFVVYKSEGRTNIRKLSAQERHEHIATMLSGNTVTEAALEQARILLTK